MSPIISPCRTKPVIITSGRTLAMERSAARQLRRELGPDTDLYQAWGLINIYRQAEFLPLAMEVLRSGFPGQDVTETEEAFRINNPLIYLPLRQEMVLDEKWRDQARLTLASDLTKLGFRVASLMPDPKVYEYAFPDQIEKMQEAGVAKEDIIFTARSSHGEMSGSIAFPRDLFTQIGDTVYLSVGEQNPYEWEGFFNWAKGLKRNYSRIGFGGEVIIADDFALLSEAVRPDRDFLGGIGDPMLDIMELSTIGETQHTLQRMGRTVHRLPTGWMELFPPEVLEELGAPKPILIPADHADLQVLHLPTENGLYFSERYYKDNREFLDRIVEQVRPDLFGTLPDENGLPINSLALPGGGVYMDAAAQASADILRQAGIRVETTSVPYGSWAWGTNGGIRCSTNLINLPAGT